MKRLLLSHRGNGLGLAGIEAMPLISYHANKGGWIIMNLIQQFIVHSDDALYFTSRTPLDIDSII